MISSTEFTANNANTTFAYVLEVMGKFSSNLLISGSALFNLEYLFLIEIASRYSEILEPETNNRMMLAISAARSALASKIKFLMIKMVLATDFCIFSL